jgi:hypothetical protein
MAWQSIAQKFQSAKDVTRIRDMLFTETFAIAAEHFYLLSNNEKQYDINDFLSSTLNLPQMMPSHLRGPPC